METKNTITFNIGEENRIVVEKLVHKEDIEKSIFSDVYTRLLTDLDKYCSSIDKHKMPENGEFLNNIFAFIGERGSGKTSCMKSVANLLQYHSDVKDDFQAIKQLSFYCLNVIDPSFIDNDTNLIGIILANLYKRFIDFDNKKGVSFQENDCSRNKLMRKFSETQRNYLRVMKSGNGKDNETEFDSLEQLSSLSSAIDLKKNIFDLVNSFLEYVIGNNSILVIPIDDIDLNSDSATSMVEQIRKYLELPNILILFSMKLDQLYQLKRRELIRQNYDAHNTVSLTGIDEMVEKYLTKLIPNNHRFYMPDGTYYWHKRIKIVDNNILKYDYPSVRQAVPALIFQKVRFLFYNSTVKTSPIVPDNLRDLRQLIRLLYDMQDPENDFEEKEGENGTKVKVKVDRINFRNNKSTFMKYLVENWMPTHLSTKSRSLISGWLNVNDPIQTNASALSTLRVEFKDEINNLQSGSDKTNDSLNELNAILSPKNLIYNISIGDVYSVIDYLERLDISYEKSCFLFMMKTMYSITLFNCYDGYTDILDAEYLQKKNNSKQDVDSSQELSQSVTINNLDLKIETVLKRSLFDDMKLPEYFKLLGGRLYDVRISDRLPKAKRTDFRSGRILGKEALNELILKCIDQDATSDDIKLAEFFMLCTGRTIDRRNDSTDSLNFNEPEFRITASLAYADDLTTSSNPFFDLSSFLYNVITYERCCKRFPHGDEFVQKILEKEETNFDKSYSLHSAFKFYTTTSMRGDKDKDFSTKKQNLDLYQFDPNVGEFTEHKWISWAGIRNYEILADLISYMNEKKYRSGNDVEVLSNYFSNLASYNILSYDLREDGADDSKADNYHSINFRFAQIISNFLNHVSTNDAIKTEFENIYNGFKVKEDDNVVTELSMSTLRFPEQKFKPKNDFAFSKTINKNVRKYYPIYNIGDQRQILNNIFPLTNEKISPTDFTTKYNELMSRLEHLVNGATPSDN